MSTNASISIMNKGGSMETIYNHWDGYLEGLGNMLLTHYTSEEKVRELIALVNVSHVDCMVNPTTTTHSFDNPEKDVTVAYGRDRGETDQEAKHFDSFVEYSKSGMIQECNYIFNANDGSWYFFEVQRDLPKKFSDFWNISNGFNYRKQQFSKPTLCWPTGFLLWVFFFACIVLSLLL